MNIRKKLLTGLLFSSAFTQVSAQDNSTPPPTTPTPVTKSSYKYDELKEKFKSSFTNTDNFVKPFNQAGSTTIDGNTVTLVPRKLNESPFVYKSENNDAENAIRLYFEPENSQYSNLYLGALYSGVKMKKNPSDFSQWSVLSEPKAYLTGKVTSKSNNINFREELNNYIYFTPSANYIKGATLPNQAIMTKINGSYSSNSTSNSRTIDAGAGYGPVSVDVSFGKSVGTNQSVIRVAAISKIYSLDVGEVYGVKSTTNMDIDKYISEIHPNQYPMYVSSIDYGFAIIAEISMSSLDQSTQTAVKAQVQYGLASGSLGVDFQNAFSNSNVNVKYSYHGINPSAPLKNSGTINDIVNMMRSEIDNYMVRFASSNRPAVPLSCTFKYLYPQDSYSEPKNVKINNLLLANQYYALATKPTFKGPMNVTIASAFMDGVPDGTFVSYGKCFVTLADNSTYSNKSHSTWWFYIPSKRSQNISEKRYKGGSYDILTIKEPELDADGNFYLYLKLVDDNCTPKYTDIQFGVWRKSDHPLNINHIEKAGNILHTVKFFNGDVTFDLKFK